MAISFRSIAFVAVLVPAAFAGADPARLAGTQISGTLNEGGAPRPVVFTRAAGG